MFLVCIACSRLIYQLCEDYIVPLLLDLTREVNVCIPLRFEAGEGSSSRLDENPGGNWSVAGSIHY